MTKPPYYNGHMSRSRGFTMIELLVVIAIIGLLTAGAFASFTRAKQKAQDTRRMEDVKELQKALAMYVASQQTFPISPTATTLTGSDAVSLALLSEGVIPAIPRDPGIYTYTYTSDATGGVYTLGFCLETDTIPNYVPGCSNTLNP